MTYNNTAEITCLKDALQSLSEKMKTTIAQQSPLIGRIHPDQQLSATNLLQYLTLRSEDIRSLQDRLHVLGLSSLASSESHILRQIQQQAIVRGKKRPLHPLPDDHL